MFENKMEKQDMRLKEEVDFAIYDLEAAKKKYLYLLGLLRQDMKSAKLREPEPALLEQQEQA